MAKNTTYYGLVRPEETDFIDVDVLGENFEKIDKYLNDIKEIVDEINDRQFPVGRIVLFGNNYNPNGKLPGTWERFANGKTIVGVDENDKDFSTVKKTGGEKDHVLTSDEMASHNHYIQGHSHALNGHTHSFSGNTGVGGNHTHKITAKYYSGQTAKGESYARWNDDGNKSTAWGSVGSAGAHSHSFSGNTGAGGSGNTEKGGSGYTYWNGEDVAHNNLQPYITGYYWIRIK